MLVNENGANEIDDGTLGLFPLPKRSSLRGSFLDHVYIRENVYLLVYVNENNKINYCQFCERI